MGKQLTPHQQEIMAEIAKKENVKVGDVFHISRRAYPKYKKERDYEWEYTEPIWVYAYGATANALLRKGLFDRDWRDCYVLTEEGYAYL